MRNQAFDYRDCLVTLEPRRRSRPWRESDESRSRALRWLAGIGALLPGAMLVAIGWRP